MLLKVRFNSTIYRMGTEHAVFPCQLLQVLSDMSCHTRAECHFEGRLVEAGGAVGGVHGSGMGNHMLSSEIIQQLQNTFTP